MLSRVVLRGVQTGLGPRVVKECLDFGLLKAGFRVVKGDSATELDCLRCQPKQNPPLTGGWGGSAHPLADARNSELLRTVRVALGLLRIKDCLAFGVV